MSTFAAAPPSAGVPLCRADAVRDGGARGFAEQALFVVRHRGRLYAWRDACPHHGTPLAWRRDAYLNAASSHIVCASHGALFDPATGVCTLGPCLGDALESVPIHIDGDGWVVATPAAGCKES